MLRVRDIETIVERGLCAGCGLCASIAGEHRVQMQMAGSSYLRPRVREALDPPTLSKILDVCPGVVVRANEPATVGPDSKESLMWGPWTMVHRAHAADPQVRFHAAAGGVLSALAIYLLESKQVDFVMHVRADPQAPMRTIVQMSRSRDEVLAGATSRYGPSAPLEQVMSALDRGQRFCFVCKPCDVAALRNLARHDPRVDEQVACMLTIFCGGVPTLETARKIARRFNLEEAEVAEFRFRGDGWPGMTHIESHHGRAFDMTYDEVWFDENMPWEYDIQFRCKLCADAIGELADVSAPDAWHIVDGQSIHHEADGWNLAIARTARGARLVEAAAAAGALVLAPFDIEELDVMHQDHVTRKTMNLARSVGLAALGEPTTRYESMRRWRLALASGLFANLVACLGAFWRGLLRRNREENPDRSRQSGENG